MGGLLRVAITITEFLIIVRFETSVANSALFTKLFSCYHLGHWWGKKQLFRDLLSSVHQGRQITDAADWPITTKWGFFIIKPTDALISQIVIKLYMFRAFPLPINRSFPLYIRHWYMSCRFDDSFQPAWYIPVPNVQWRTSDDGWRLRLSSG